MSRVRLLRLAVLAGLLLSFPGSVRAQTPGHPLFTGPVYAPPEVGYTPLHVALDAALDWDGRRVTGQATYQLRRTDPTWTPLVLHARDLAVDSVRAGWLDAPVSRVSFQQSGDSLIIALPQAAADTSSAALAAYAPPADSLFQVTIAYAATPARGLRFEPATGAARFAWTEDAPGSQQHWMPAWPDPHALVTSTLAVQRPEGGRLAATGRIADEPSAAPEVVRYEQDQPHAIAHLAFAAGPFAERVTTVRLASGLDVPLRLLAEEDQLDALTQRTAILADALPFSSSNLRMPYPWPNLTVAAVPGIDGGALHPGTAQPGLSTGTGLLLLDAASPADPGVEAMRLVEALAQQWFGHVVTPAPWTDVWLRFGPAAYVAALFDAERSGPAALSLRLATLADAYFEEAQQYQRPLVWDRWTDPAQLLDAHARAKGAWVLHRLRAQTGDARFWRALQRYLRTHAMARVDTEDLRSAFETAADDDLGGLFDQWVYAAGHPVLDVGYAYDARASTLDLSVTQQQDGPLVPEIFRGRLGVAVATLAGRDTFGVALDDRSTEARREVRLRPRFVHLDPDQTWLAEVRLEQPAAAWVAQLRDAPSVPARLGAARSLAAYRDDPALLIGLRSALQADPPAPVRSAVATLLGGVLAADSTGQVERALLESLLADPVAEVRAAAVEALGMAPSSPDTASLLGVRAQEDTDPDVQAAAVEALARLVPAGTLDLVRSALITPSPGEVIRRAALRAVGHLDLPARQALTLAEPFLAADQPLALRLQALDTLAPLAPAGRRVAQALLPLVRDPVPAVRAAAAKALAANGLAAAAAPIATQLADEPYPAVREVQRQALAQLETADE